MRSNDLFTISYQLHGERKTFIVRAPRMDNDEAWHWASCDAGLAFLPKFGQQNVKRLSKPMAEKYGITGVSWRGTSGSQ